MDQPQSSGLITLPNEIKAQIMHATLNQTTSVQPLLALMRTCHALSSVARRVRNETTAQYYIYTDARDLLHAPAVTPVGSIDAMDLKTGSDTKSLYKEIDDLGAATLYRIFGRLKVQGALRWEEALGLRERWERSGFKVRAVSGDRGGAAADGARGVKRVEVFIDERRLRVHT